MSEVTNHIVTIETLGTYHNALKSEVLDNKKDKQTAVSSPSASSTDIAFIDTISQNENGEITATKKTVRTGSASQSGVVPAATKGKFLHSNASSGALEWVDDNDSKVTSSANHYTPSTASGSDKSASASGATAAWGIDVVKGVTLNTDGKGHVTGISVTSGKIPANPNTDNTGIKLGTVEGTKKTDSTVIKAASSTGLNIAGGTNKFSIGDGTNYIEVPVASGITVTSSSVSDGTTTFNKYTHPTTTAVGAAAKKVGMDALGHVVLGASLGKSDVGLGNVTNDAQVKRTEMGAASGVATLDSNGKVPTSQLPSYVDDVIEGYYKAADGKFYSTLSGTTYSGEITGETGKIYIDLSTEKTYRWGGTAYAEISASLALGETSSTAYRGDRGKIAYDHSQVTSGNPHNVTKADVGLGNVKDQAITVTSTSVSDGTNTFNKYTHPTSAGNKHIPTGGSSGQFLGYSASGTATWVNNPNTDTSVTAVGNHYTPVADTNAELTATLEGTAGAYALNTEYTVLTGVKAQRDAAGHVVGITYTAQKVKDTNNTYTVNNKAFKIAGDTGTATQAISTNDSAERTLTIAGGTNMSTAVSGSSGAVTLTINHGAAGTGSALTTSNGTASAYALNTEYTVLTGITVTADANGHITGVSTTRQKVKDTNTTYSVFTASANGLVPMASTANKQTSGNDNVAATGTFLLGADAKFYKLPANAFQNTTYSDATQSTHGLMSTADKTKLDNMVYATDEEVLALFA